MSSLSRVERPSTPEVFEEELRNSSMVNPVITGLAIAALTPENGDELKLKSVVKKGKIYPWTNEQRDLLEECVRNELYTNSKGNLDNKKIQKCLEQAYPEAEIIPLERIHSATATIKKKIKHEAQIATLGLSREVTIKRKAPVVPDVTELAIAALGPGKGDVQLESLTKRAKINSVLSYPRTYEQKDLLERCMGDELYKKSGGKLNNKKIAIEGEGYESEKEADDIVWGPNWFGRIEPSDIFSEIFPSSSEKNEIEC